MKKKRFRKRVRRINYKNSNRNFREPQYVEFRRAVRKRDGKYCQFPDCNRKANEVHHIKTWEKFPSLRFETTNGIFLCKRCHKLTKGREEQYEFMLSEIVRKNEKIQGEN